jgi:hypothetical protein
MTYTIVIGSAYYSHDLPETTYSCQVLKTGGEVVSGCMLMVGYNIPTPENKNVPIGHIVAGDHFDGGALHIYAVV